MHRSFFKFPLASLIVLAASASAQNPPAAATSTLGVQSADPLLQTAEVMPWRNIPCCWTWRDPESAWLPSVSVVMC